MHIQLGAKTLALTLPVWIIGSYDETGRPNAMAASWAGVCCSNPPCVYAAVRESRHTFNCISHSKAFTVNIPGIAQARESDYFGMASGKSTDKIAGSGLTACKSSFVDAPYISEFPLALHCSLTKTVSLGSHAMFVGEILETTCEEGYLDKNGGPDISKINPIAYNTADGTYYAIGGAIGNAYALGKDIGK